VYAVGYGPSQTHHTDIMTFAFRAATGKQLWLRRDDARGGETPADQLAVAPSGRTVIITGQRNGGGTGAYALAAYNASTGATRWSTAGVLHTSVTAGLVVDPSGNTVYAASDSYDPRNPGTPPVWSLVAYSVTDGSTQWTSTHSGGSAASLAISGDGSRLFITGAADEGQTMATAAYQP
jgi:hypothetical protein